MKFESLPAFFRRTWMLCWRGTGQRWASTRFRGRTELGERRRCFTRHGSAQPTDLKPKPITPKSHNKSTPGGASYEPVIKLHTADARRCDWTYLCAEMYSVSHRTGRSGILGRTFSAMLRRTLSFGRAPDALHTVMSQ